MQLVYQPHPPTELKLAMVGIYRGVLKERLERKRYD